MSCHHVTGRSRPLPGEPLRLSRLSKFIAAGAVASAQLISPLTARAADLVKAPTAPVYNWTGCYIGVNAGGGASGSDFTTNVGPGGHLSGGDIGSGGTVGVAGTGSANDSSYMAGGQTGCNWQTGTLVLGLEGDVDYFHSHPGFINDTAMLSDTSPFTISQRLTTDYLATIRPRIGVAADRNLGYVTGGVAFTNANYTQNYFDQETPAPGAGGLTASKMLVGWTVGAGWEYAWSEHWTLKFEYLFTSFPGNVNGLGSISDAAGGTNPLSGSADLTIQTARAGVNFKF
jgi:outer membrane immunogenic protein